MAATEQRTDSAIRILHVLGRLDRGGAEAMVMNLYRQVDRNRVQFDFVLHTEDECAYSEEVRSFGGRIFSVPAYSPRSAAGYKRAWKELLSKHPEWKILHSHVRSTASLYLPIAHKLGIKTIIHSHNTASGSGVSAFVKTMLQYPLRYQADFLFACSEAAGKWLYGETACKSNRFYLLKNAIDTKRFAFRPEIREAKRKELGISEQTFVIGHVGRFEEQKNHRFLMEIYEALQKKIEAQDREGAQDTEAAKKEAKKAECTLLLIGEGKLEAPIRELAKQKNLTNIRFLGSRADVNELLSAMDVFVFPSLFEGLPVTLIEAQAAGLPVIASDTITAEAVLTPLVQLLSLEQSTDVWAEQIEGAAQQSAMKQAEGAIQEIGAAQIQSAESMTRQRSGAEAIRAICEAGYDITRTTGWLTKFYESID